VKRLVAVACACSLLLAATGIARATFWAPATATVAVTVGPPVVPRPGNVACVTQGAVVVSRWAHFTWTPPAGAPQPTQYVIRALNGTTVVELARPAGTATSFDLTSGLLVGTLAAVLSLLLGGGTFPVTVNAVYGTYESPPAYLHHLRGELGLVSGIGCANGPTP
jgi:hypothetical protein